MQRCFPIDDSRYAYLGPEFDITTTNREVYVNSFQIDYSKGSLKQLVETSGKIVSKVIDTNLYVANGKVLRRKRIDTTKQFADQIDQFDNWDDYITPWATNTEYQFDSDIKCFLTKYVKRGESIIKRMIVLTEGNMLYVSEYDEEK